MKLSYERLVITGATPVSDDTALLAALTHMRISCPDGIAFEKTLAARNGWSAGFTDRVADEYRRFLYLAAIAGFEVTPSRAVDEAWHLHLTLPHYREILCGRILGRPLDHLPGAGTEADDDRCARQYGQTLALYERVFAEPAPGDIWPRPLDAEESDFEEERRLGDPLGLAAAAFGLVAGLVALPFGPPVLAAVLLGGAVILGVASSPSVGRRKRSADSGGGSFGGSCGGSDGGDGDGGSCSDGGGGDGGGGGGCCASCGGSCGGGGGGD